MCVCAHAHTRVPQAGRAREGRGRRSHRARTDVVLTTLRRERPKEGLGGGCPLGHTASQHSLTTKNDSYNTHHHQSGHSHSALDSEALTAGGREGQGRWADEVSADLHKFQLWTSLRIQGGEQS